MSSQYLPFEVIEKGKTEPTPYLVQLQIREIKLYEIICPKECEDKVMAMIKPSKFYGKAAKFNKLIKILSKILGLKKPSKNWEPALLPPTEGIALAVLGTKDDQMNWIKKEPKDVHSLGGNPREQL